MTSKGKWKAYFVGEKNFRGASIGVIIINLVSLIFFMLIFPCTKYKFYILLSVLVIIYVCLIIDVLVCHTFTYIILFYICMIHSQFEDVFGMFRSCVCIFFLIFVGKYTWFFILKTICFIVKVDFSLRCHMA